MNKFVKGAKNLAFALSFVTVAACGVKKGDLENLEKSLSEKIGKKADLDSCVSKNELTNINGEVEKKIVVEVQKIKTEVLTQIADDKKDVLLGVLKTDFSNLGDIARTKGCGKLLDGFKFVGGFKDSDITVVGKVEKDYFKKEIGTSNAVNCDDGFFKEFVKCGGQIVLEGVENCTIETVGGKNQLKINGKDSIAVADFCKVFAFWKLCGVLGSIRALNWGSVFKDAKKFGVVAKDLNKEESESIINAIADDNSIKYDGEAKKNSNLIVASFTIGGEGYSWDIANS